MKKYQGISVSPGLVLGQVSLLKRETYLFNRSQHSPEKEELVLEEAVRIAQNELDSMAGRSAVSEQAIFTFQSMLLEDDTFMGEVRSYIQAGTGAAEAMNRVGQRYADKLLAMTDNAYLQLRNVDILDVTQRVVNILAGRPRVLLTLDHPVILAADKLMPSDLFSIPSGMILGIITSEGSSLSHAAIIARARGIPSIIQVGRDFLDDCDGRIVVLDADTGSCILDPDADYSGYFRDIMWKNKTITELYYPGSVFKVITAAMGVDSGNATYNTTFNCSGAYAVAKETYHCAGRHSHGTQNLADALLNSCNIYFIQLGQRIGVQTFYDYFKAFGFTERTGVDLPNETSYMQYYTDQNMGEVELASSAFGQSMAVTPLQVCTAVAASVNGGYLVTPHVVDQIVDANGNVVEQIGPGVRRQVISGSASETIRQIMEHEVGDGTTRSGGYRAYVAGYRIGGKSGTSELLNMDRRADGDYKKAASFVAVLPADDPQILVYVMLDDPNNVNSDYSSVLAAPVVGNIISEIAPYLGVATDGIDRSGQTVKVPNLIGTEWSNAQVNLNIRGLAHHLVESEGGNTAAPVTWQYPTAGTEVPSGTTIYLYTDTYTGQTAQVPDLTGKSADFARQMLQAAGFNCIVEGSASGLVQAQSEAPGSTAQLGTIVTITCG